MYKIYLSPSTQDKSFGVGDFGTEEYRMNQIADVVETTLLSNEGNIVYRNKPGMTKEQIIEDSNKFKPDIHIAIHSNCEGGKGPSCYIKVGDEKSNGCGKEIYKEILKVYYDSQAGNGIIYDKNIKEIMNVGSPAILIEVAFHDNLKDVEWIINNTQKIAKAIVEGINRGLNLKLC